jgi:Tfp pilus assembly protein PilO
VSQGPELWWERRWVWLPAALFVLVGVALLLGYQLAFAGRLGLQAGALESRRRELEEVTARRRETEALVQRARSTRAAIDELYDERLGSEAARLTAVMLEVKHLAQQAGLSGIEAINYGDEAVTEMPLVKKSITFGAGGSYEQLRAFINLLELSPSFMSLDEIRVAGDAPGGRLRLQVRLSTMFLDEDAPLPGAATPPRATPPGAAPPEVALPAATPPAAGGKA